MSSPLWTFNNLTLAGDHRPRLDNISGVISSGVTAVVGHSGAGKTSLFNVLVALEKPSAGTVDFQNSAPVSGNLKPFSLPVFWVPQDSGLWAHLPAIEHLAAVFERDSLVSGSGMRDSREFLDKLLSDFDLSDRRQALPSELSRGEQSRLAVCRALTANPAVLIMDEPLAHVDPTRRPAYWKRIRKHLQTTGASLLFSTHEPDVAVRESEFVVCMKQGKIIHSGMTQDVYHRPISRAVAEFLGPLNWFEPGEQTNWFTPDDESKSAIAVRPENLDMQVDQNGNAEILSFQFCGGYSETRLKHIETAAEKTIIHRPPGNVFCAGQRVCIKVLS